MYLRERGVFSSVSKRLLMLARHRVSKRLQTSPNACKRPCLQTSPNACMRPCLDDERVVQYDTCRQQGDSSCVDKKKCTVFDVIPFCVDKKKCTTFDVILRTQHLDPRGSLLVMLFYGQEEVLSESCVNKKNSFLNDSNGRSWAQSYLLCCLNDRAGSCGQKATCSTF